MLALYQTENLNLFCIPAPWNDFTKPGLTILHYSHTYYLIKIIDLLDTVFFILRKKNNQVSFLHIYHHSVMVVGCYCYIKFMSGGGHALVLGKSNRNLWCHLNGLMRKIFFCRSRQLICSCDNVWLLFLDVIQA